MTVSERIDWHKNEMLRPGSQTTYFNTYQDKSIFDIHIFLIDLLQDKNIDMQLYNRVICQFFKDYPNDILFNIKPFGWDDKLPFGKYKGTLLKKIPEDYLKYLYDDLNYLNFNREVIIYITSMKELTFPVKYLKKQSSTKNYNFETDSYENFNPIELDACGGEDLY